MSLPAFSLTHKPVVLLVTVLLIAAGLFQYTRAPRAEDPQFVIRDAVLVTAWPGGTAEEVERLVTDPLETALAPVAAPWQARPYAMQRPRKTEHSIWAPPRCTRS